MWAMLPDDLLVDIFRRLEATAVIRCAATCQPWRRAVIDNASCLRPRPDCFNPNLLVGFLETSWGLERHTLRRLQYVPASDKVRPFFRSSAAGVNDDVVDDGRPRSNLVSSRDGFLLFRGDKENSLRLYRPLTGTCRALPAAAFDDSIVMGLCVYVLVTSYDVDDNNSGNGNGDELAVWIIAAMWAWDVDDGMTYQIFSSVSGAWGPIKRSTKFPADKAGKVFMQQSDVVVCGGAVYWLVYLAPNDMSGEGTCGLLAMDLRTERTWTTEVPALASWPILATSEDGRPSLVTMVSSLPGRMEMAVWVLAGDDQWTLRRTVDVPNMILDCHSWRFVTKGFCPRSGCLFGMSMDEQDVQLHHHLLIAVEGGFTQLIRKINYDYLCDTVLPYEMDWSTYISKLKYF